MTFLFLDKVPYFATSWCLVPQGVRGRVTKTVGSPQIGRTSGSLILVREWVDEAIPAKKLVLVMDDLNIFAPCSLYEAFEPAVGRCVLERLVIHYTPKHGSRLNIAEIEIGVLSRQCLARRIPDRQTLLREDGAWQERRNRQKAAVNWRFKTADARIKLKPLCPSIQ